MASQFISTAAEFSNFYCFGEYSIWSIFTLFGLEEKATLVSYFPFGQRKFALGYPLYTLGYSF
ncbi:MAG: hypothetical protein KC422_23135 [Trueperaceae bacterium]|nr:hypothetical protein [Trueperaceae bacterium]